MSRWQVWRRKISSKQGGVNSQKDKIVKYANSPTKQTSQKGNQIKKQQSKVSKSKKYKNKNLKIPLYKKHKKAQKHKKNTPKKTSKI